MDVVQLKNEVKRRNTSQKCKILAHIKTVKTHPTAEEVFEALRKELPSISLATVYRNLNLLFLEGRVLRLEINGEYHFDGDMCNHQHFVCKNCGCVLDVFQETISQYALNNVDCKDFFPECVQIIFKGHCRSCSLMYNLEKSG